MQQELADALGAVVTAHDMPGFGLSQRFVCLFPLLPLVLPMCCSTDLRWMCVLSLHTTAAHCVAVSKLQFAADCRSAKVHSLPALP